MASKANKTQNQKTVKIEVKGATTVPMEKLEPFQGELKTLERAEYEALRENILKNGFSFTIHVWQHKNKNYIIDGHQRLFAVKQMAEVDGYKIPPLPVSIVQAKTFAAAKLKVLAGVSNYGKMTEKSLTEFLKINDIPYDHIVSTFKFPTIDVLKISESINEIKESANLDEIPSFDPEQMRSSGEGVKQIQLFMDSKSHEKFMANVAILSKHYGKENISDTLFEVADEKAKSIKKK